MAEKEKLTMVVFSDDLDRTLFALMLAIMGAAMGMEVTMFFTFWGLNIIRRHEGGSKGKGLTKKVLNFFNRGGSRRLKLSRFNTLGLGTWIMKRRMREIDMPSIDELITMAKDSGVKFIACTTAMEIMGVNKDSFRSELDDVSGAAYFLSQASKSKVALFI
ncbi:MAG: DsrE/DsrF/DrsH-like family protein [Dehalococcoidales bacterium]